MSVSCARDVVRVDGFARFARNFADGDHPFHGADVRQLRRAKNNVADGVDARLGSLHPGINLYKAPIRLDVGLFQANTFSARFATDRDQNFFGINFLLFAVHGKSDGDTGFSFFDLVYFGASVEIDAALAEGTGQFFGDFFVFDGNKARQHFENRDLTAERFVDGSEFDADRASANNDE